jgi:hypothetical protein
MSRQALFYAFVIMLFLLGAVYFIGVATDAKAFGAAINQLVLSLTGRTSSGTFANYPASTATLQRQM